MERSFGTGRGETGRVTTRELFTWEVGMTGSSKGKVSEIQTSRERDLMRKNRKLDSTRKCRESRVFYRGEVVVRIGLVGQISSVRRGGDQSVSGRGIGRNIINQQSKN